MGGALSAACLYGLREGVVRAGLKCPSCGDDNVDMGPADPKPDNRRRHGRIRSHDLTTRYGEVLDLSASGVRVRGEVPLPDDGTVTQLDIIHPEGRVNVKARVVWVKRPVDSYGEIGFEFEDMNATTRAGITAVARLAMNTIAIEYQSPSD